MTPELSRPEVTDGRHLRRDRNREAVVRALLELYNEGNLDPATDEIAARSRVSARSVFRYFDDVDDLCNAAINQAQLDVAPLITIDARPLDPTATKVAAVAAQRGELFEAIESVGTVMRLRAPFQLVVAERLARNRAFLRDQLRTVFTAELAALPPAVAEVRLAAADVAASFEAWRLLRDDQGFTRAMARAAVAENLLVLFTTPAGAPR